MTEIELVGVRQNNLKNVSLNLPLGQAIVVTGPSGSGKSSLAFETVYAEGQRRFLQSLSTYARQFLQKFRAPLADAIRNIPPSIALEQANPVRNARATVGTTTELYDYLRLFFEKVGREYCADCGVAMERRRMPELAEDALQMPKKGEALLLAYRLAAAKDKAVTTQRLTDALAAGFTRIVAGQEIVATEDAIAKLPKEKDLFVIVDRLRVPEGAVADESLLSRVAESIGVAMPLGLGFAVVLGESEKKARFLDDLTLDSRCPKCRVTAPPKSSASFSFNSPLGACERCKGFGNTLEVDEQLVVPNAKRTIAQGAIEPFTKPSLADWQKKTLAFCKAGRIDADLPWGELPAADKKRVLDGEGKFLGVRGVFEALKEDKYKLQIRVFVSRYVSPFACPECKGARVNRAALRVRVTGKTISELVDMNVDTLLSFFRNIALTDRERAIAADILRQVDRRLEYLNTVGLGYLTLARLTRTLSGGEYQRILLATQLSQRLTDTLYVLDEPSIGLHPRDTDRLLGVLGKLREQGNTLLIVEHDPGVIEWAEHVVDVGPGSGTRGGEIVFEGTQKAFAASKSSTAVALRGWRDECRARAKPKKAEKVERWLEIEGCKGNNLQNVSARFPLNRVVAVTGVSGSGKSTLIVDTLYPALAKMFHSTGEKIERFASLSGFEHLQAIELVDQSGIGKSSRSNPVTFLKAFDEIRQLFAQAPEAMARRLTPGHFSFNVAGGRCEKCEGEGRIKVEMVFLEDIWIPCDECDEKRFKPNILAVRLRGKNIDDVLRMTADEAYDFFPSNAALRAKLSLLKEVGLGYLQLGQPGFTLSGGEAQRLKIARELGSSPLKRPPTLFIFDEPTTGLHFQEVELLIDTLRRLVREGHSVIVIEHNLQMICAADYVVDLGPDGGDGGGHVVAVGTPWDLAQKGDGSTARYLREILVENKA